MQVLYEVSSLKIPACSENILPYGYISFDSEAESRAQKGFFPVFLNKKHTTSYHQCDLIHSFFSL